MTILALFTLHAPLQAGWLDTVQDLASDMSSQESPQAQSPSIMTNASNNEISMAFKESLQIAADKVVSQLGIVDGFNADKAIHIPLPQEFESIRPVLGQIGLSDAVDDLELKLNRAAETATPKAQALFVESIQSMTFSDVQKIYNGPNDSATRYFKNKMSVSLREEMAPIVTDSLAEVGAIQAYDNITEQLVDIPYLPDVKANLTDYVVTKGMDGIFYYMGKQEAAIRENPVQQTTDLLKKVFGNQ